MVPLSICLQTILVCKYLQRNLKGIMPYNFFSTHMCVHAFAKKQEGESSRKTRVRGGLL